MADNIIQETKHTSEIDRESIGRNIWLHLLPGILMSAAFIVASSPAVMRFFSIPEGLRYNFALLPGALVIIVSEILILRGMKKKSSEHHNAKFSAAFRQTLKWWEYALWVLVPLVFSLLFLTTLGPVLDDFLMTRCFAWLPAWLLPTAVDYSVFRGDPLAICLITAGILLSGLVVPIVEELYFRGFLLSRLMRLKWWAPVVNVVLFSLYHFFTPWANLSRIIVLLPMVVIVYWKRNIYIGIIVHCLINLIGIVPLLFMVLN